MVIGEGKPIEEVLSMISDKKKLLDRKSVV